MREKITCGWGKSRITGEIKGTQSKEEDRVQIVLRSNIKCMRVIITCEGGNKKDDGGK